MQHPYLYFSKYDVEKYKEKLAHNPEAKQKYDNVVKNAENCLNEDIVTWEQAEYGNATNQHCDFGKLNQQAYRFCETLGTKYIVEGDTRCAEKIKEMLLQFISYERWYARSYKQRQPVAWHSDLCSTGTTLACAQAYDLIHDYLTPEEQDTVAKGIFEKGVMPALGDWALPETRIHAMDSMGHNWWSVCIGESATAFLTLTDHLPQDTVKEILNKVESALCAYFSYKGNHLFNKFANFDGLGLFYESVGYSNYGTGTPLRFLLCYERYFGRNDTIRACIPKNLANGIVGMSYPHLDNEGKNAFLTFCYGDSTDHETLDSIGKYCVRLGLDSSAMRAQIKDLPVSLWEEIAGLNLKALKGSMESLPKTMIYSSGYVTTRNSWDPDATAFSAKCGYCWNHSHNDAGSFQIYHKGKMLFVDGGTCSYDAPEYHQYYCQGFAHSVLSVNGGFSRNEELYRGTKFPGILSDTYEGKDFLYVQADAAGPYAHVVSRMYRNFMWIDNRILVIVDDVLTHTAGVVGAQFHWNYGGTFVSDGNVVNLELDGAKAKLTSVYPGNLVYTEKIGHAPHDEKRNTKYFAFEEKPLGVIAPEDETAFNGRAIWETKPYRVHDFIHTIELDPDEHKTAVTKLESTNAVGVRLEDEQIVRDIWYNIMADGRRMHDNSNNTIAGYDTDAYMLVITKNKQDNVTRIFAVSCSYLRRDEKVLYSSFAKQTKEIVAEL